MIDVKAIRREMRRRQIKMPQMAEHIGEGTDTLYRHLREGRLTVREVRAMQDWLRFPNPESVFFIEEVDSESNNEI